MYPVPRNGENKKKVILFKSQTEETLDIYSIPIYINNLENIK